QLWVGTGNGHIHIIDTLKKEEIHAFRFHKLTVFDIKYSEKLKLVFSVGGDGILNVYDPQNLKHLHSIKLSDAKMRSLDFFENEILLAEGSGKTIVLNAETLQIKTEFQSHEHATNCFLTDEKSHTLFSGGRDAHLKLWDLKNNFSLIRSIPAHNFAIYKIIDLEPLEIIASASRDKTFKLWNKNNMEILLRVNHENNAAHTHSVNSLLWHKSSQTLISASDDRMLMSWKIVAS
ncbi:MAG: WD40 repeat domain-containing protein, partial [Bacteroidia bacterium]|nr:WD40 repeat domain-containing protein [Bacteroidia bacterium]